jgi:hypothetical protein
MLVAVVVEEVQKMRVQLAALLVDRVLVVQVQPGQGLLPLRLRPEPRVQEAVVVVGSVQVAQVQALALKAVQVPSLCVM